MIENLLELTKELIDIKSEEEEIINTRNQILNLNQEGDLFVKEVYDEFPELENYLYLNDIPTQINHNSLQNKIVNLIRRLNFEIGPSFLSEFMKTNTSLLKLSDLALQKVEKENAIANIEAEKCGVIKTSVNEKKAST